MSTWQFKQLRGSFFNGTTSAKSSCVLQVSESGIVSFHGFSKGDVKFSDLTFSPRVGNTPRTIYFADGSFFESTDNNEIDSLIKQFSVKHKERVLYLLESKLEYVLVATVVVCVSIVGFVYWGIPALSKQVAYTIPNSYSSQIGLEAFHELDKRFFEPSQLAIERQMELAALFESTLNTNNDFDYKIFFRSGDDIGANALAFPNGYVVVTDELVKLANSNQELLSVLYHEIGHVEKRHSLRMIVQSSSLLVVFAWMLGDIEAFLDLSVALPAFLVRQHYSKEIEREADEYALRKMLAAEIDPIYFASIMTSLKEHNDKSESNNTLLDIISSHPPTDERILKFKQASESFKDN